MIPQEVRNIRCIDWRDFERAVLESDPQIDDAIDGGDVLILKGAFSEAFMDMLRDRTITWTKTRPESFHKMLDGCPDFHRKIDIETGKKYSIHGCKHSAYFFRWNSDPIGVWEEITKRWRIIKLACGLRPDEYEGNKPSDGPTDRIQVVRYLPTYGYLEPHRDAYENQKCFISGYMSKRGKDYEGGGIYFVKDGKAVFAEDMIDVGDLSIGHANLLHGVAPCDVGKPGDFDKTDGRWFLGLYSNDSDYVEKRKTSAPERIELEGVRP